MNEQNKTPWWVVQVFSDDGAVNGAYVVAKIEDLKHAFEFLENELQGINPASDESWQIVEMESE